MKRYPRNQVRILISAQIKVKRVPVMRHHSMKTYGAVNTMFPAHLIMALPVDTFSPPTALPLTKRRETQGWSERSGGRETNC